MPAVAACIDSSAHWLAECGYIIAVHGRCSEGAPLPSLVVADDSGHRRFSSRAVLIHQSVVAVDQVHSRQSLHLQLVGWVVGKVEKYKEPKNPEKMNFESALSKVMVVLSENLYTH